MVGAPRFARLVQPPAAGGKPRSLVVALHGLGCTAATIADLGVRWGPVLPHTEFVIPNAPDPYDLEPGLAGAGFQWFSMKDRSLRGLTASVAAGAPALDGFLDEILAERGLDESRTALVGFSQGGMIALHVGLRRPKPMAALVGIATMMLAGPELAGQIRARPPVMLVHGDADELVPVSAHAATVAMLRAVDVAVEAELRPEINHAMDEGGLARCADFVAAAFNRA